MFWRLHGVTALLGLLPGVALANPGIIQVTGVRSWSHPDSTRVIIDTTGPFDFKTDGPHQPDRLSIDILHARPWIARRRFATQEVHDRLIRRVSVSQTGSATTHIVFDLLAPAELKISKLATPDRMVIELRPLHKPPPPVATPMVYTSLYTSRRFTYPVPPAKRQIYIPPPPAIAAPPSEVALLSMPLPSWGVISPPKRGPQQRLIPRYSAPVATSVPQGISSPPGMALKLPPAPPPYRAIDAAPLASENGSRSLTRALGLKVNRVVIDAGHGGHDDGTIGPHGVMEKDVVLDVSLRLARLIGERMGADVVLTRSDDTFIPLHERTSIANDRKADLFLSIHANSSPSPEVAGTETFFLNFTTSAASLDVAARENAGSDRNVADLKDLIQSITLNDKIEESHTFAQDVQNAIHAQASKINAGSHDRGVKRAPFVVLIGASMPSVLAEIGFLSNARDEINLSKPEYRQKIAEALYKGLTQYSLSLSHFDVSRQAARPDKAVTAGLER